MSRSGGCRSCRIIKTYLVSCLISGETGAGKSAMRRLSIKSIIELSLSNAGKKGAKLGSQIPSAEVSR